MQNSKKFFKNSTLFLEQIKKKGLGQKNYNDLIKWGSIYGELLFSNHVGIYRDDDFEKKFLELFIYRKKEICSTVPLCFNEKEDELHIITTPLSTGGHTRLMEIIIKIRDHGDVLITNKYELDQDSIKIKEGNKIHSSDKGFTINELIEIISKYKKVFLHINPGDLLSSCAVGFVKKSKNINVYFVNHADHRFSFGFYSSNLILEVSGYGYYLTKKERNLDNTYLGLPLRNSDFKDIKHEEKKENIKIFLSGNSSKFRPYNNYLIQKTISEILSKFKKTNVTIVGPDIRYDYWWWIPKIKNLKRLNISKNIPFNQYESIITAADLYIDSYPEIGGTAFPEMRGRGIPVTGIVTDAIGYTPFDATKYASSDELVSAIEEFIYKDKSGILAKNNDAELLIKAEYAHSKKNIEFRLDNIINNEGRFAPFAQYKNININMYTNEWMEKKIFHMSVSSIKVLLSNPSQSEFFNLKTILKLISRQQIVYVFIKTFDLLLKILITSWQRVR